MISLPEKQTKKNAFPLLDPHGSTRRVSPPFRILTAGTCTSSALTEAHIFFISFHVFSFLRFFQHNPCLHNFEFGSFHSQWPLSSRRTGHVHIRICTYKPHKYHFDIFSPHVNPCKGDFSSRTRMRTRKTSTRVSFATSTLRLVAVVNVDVRKNPLSTPFLLLSFSLSSR